MKWFPLLFLVCLQCAAPRPEVAHTPSPGGIDMRQYQARQPVFISDSTGVAWSLALYIAEQDTIIEVRQNGEFAVRYRNYYGTYMLIDRSSNDWHVLALSREHYGNFLYTYYAALDEAFRRYNLCFRGT